MSGQVEDDKVTGQLVDMDPKKGTITLEVEGDFVIALWPPDMDAEIGDMVTVSMEDVLN